MVKTLNKFSLQIFLKIPSNKYKKSQVLVQQILQFGENVVNFQLLFSKFVKYSKGIYIWNFRLLLIHALLHFYFSLHTGRSLVYNTDEVTSVLINKGQRLVFSMWTHTFTNFSRKSGPFTF